MMVQPQQLVGVERTGRFADRPQREELDHLFAGEDLLIAMGPTQTHQIVKQRFRQVAIVAILHHADRPVALGEFLAIVAVDHRYVRVYRHRRVQRFKDVDLARRVIDMIFTTDHVGDRHVPVIHDDAEVVGRGTIGTANDQIVQLLVAELDRSADLIVKNN
ncbi:hypothetical protein SB00610_04760 [Klebsiella quasipneumoniae subsp. similipneumoniae]|nr:hypothetical protein SB00610_04760 [Klebsiella quasipneumoniae subsp. similipneumoniae]